MSVVADSTVLIAITKIGQLGLLKKLYGSVLVPAWVYQEVVVEGKRLHKSGVGEIEQGIQQGWINVIALKRNQEREAAKYRAVSRIGKGEAEALVLAKIKKIPLIADDRHARELATVLGIRFIGTAAVLLHAHWKRILDKKEFIENLKELGKALWLSPEIIAELVLLAEEAK